MKLTKCGTLVNKTTYLFTSMRDSNNSRRCAKNLEFSGRGGGGGGKFWGPILEDPEGKGVIQQIPSVGVVWIFSGTTQCESTCTAEEVSYQWL